MVTRRFLVLFAVAAVALAACSGSAAETAAETAATDAEGSSTNAAAAGGLTLGDFFPSYLRSEDPEAAEAESYWRNLAAEEQIRDCMAAQGFEYIPYVRTSETLGYRPTDLTHEEFVRRYGYGTFTFFREEMAAVLTYDPGPPEDPNYAIRRALDEEERAEYERALWGESPDLSEDMIDEEIRRVLDNFEYTGCEPTVKFEVWGTTEFGDDLQDLRERVEADRRMVDARAEWAACMADRGYGFATMDEIHEYLNIRAEEVFTNATMAMDDTLPEITEEERQALIAEMEQQTDVSVIIDTVYDEAELQALMDEEVAIAVAEMECSRPVDATYDEVFAEYEAEFVAANLDRLDPYRIER